MVPTSVASDLPSCYFDPSWQAGAMDIALAEARKAAISGDVPVGAAVFLHGDLVAKAGNEREASGDPLAHAECTALRLAAKAIGGWRLSEAVVVVTLEPCPMCMGALLNARVGLLIYGASDPRAGAAGTLYDLSRDPRLNHSFPVIRGVRREESVSLLRDFFEARRV